MIASRFSAALAGSAILAASGGALADHTIIERTDVAARNQHVTDAYSGQELVLGTNSAPLNQLDIGAQVSIDGSPYDLVSRRLISHQGPAFVMSAPDVAQQAGASHLTLTDALSGAPFEVDLGEGQLGTLRAGQVLSVDGERHMVSAVIQDMGGDTILTTPFPQHLADWGHSSAAVLKFTAGANDAMAGQAVS